MHVCESPWRAPAGTPCGESFRLWYNEAGATSDFFTPGMGIMGDPLLTEANLELLEGLYWLSTEGLDT